MEMTDWIDILLFLCHPISIKHKYEVVSQETINFNQPSIFSGNLIYFAYKCFDRAKKASIYEIYTK